MTMTVAAAGVLLAVGLSLPVLLVYLLRTAGREERPAEEEVARALARVAQTIAGSSAPGPTGDRPGEARPREARPRTHEAA